MGDFIFSAIVVILIMVIFLLWKVKDKKSFFNTVRDKYGLLFRICISISFILILFGIASNIRTEKPELLYSERAKFIISGFVLIGLFYSILAYEFNVKKNRDDRRSQKSASTFTILSTWYNAPLTDHSKTIDTFERSDNYKLLKNDLDKFIIYYDSNTEESIELRKAVRSIFNYFEIISAGIKEGVIDKDFVKRYFEDVFAEYYKDWINFIKKRREKSSGMYSEFTNLVETW